MTDEHKALWSNQRISDFANNAPSAWEARRLYDAMRRIRDDYEAALATQAQAASEWTPVENGTYHMDGPELIEVKDALIKLYADSTPAATYLPRGYALCRRVPHAQPAPRAGE